MVFPLFMLVALGTVDVTSMLYDWVLANKATYVGARAAVVSNPVAHNLTEDWLLYNASQLKQMGRFCFDFATGTSNGNCPAPSVTEACKPAAISTARSASAPEKIKIGFTLLISA